MRGAPRSSVVGILTLVVLALSAQHGLTQDATTPVQTAPAQAVTSTTAETPQTSTAAASQTTGIQTAAPAAEAPVVRALDAAQATTAAQQPQAVAANPQQSAQQQVQPADATKSVAAQPAAGQTATVTPVAAAVPVQAVSFQTAQTANAETSSQPAQTAQQAVTVQPTAQAVHGAVPATAVAVLAAPATAVTTTVAQPAAAAATPAATTPVATATAAATPTAAAPAAGTPAVVAQAAPAQGEHASAPEQAAKADAQNATQPAPAPKPKVVKQVQIVAQAPAANVTNDDDIDADGACKQSIVSLCKDMEVGEGAVAECLSQAISEKEGSQQGEQVPKPCRDEVYDFFVERNTNINKNIPLARACKLDAEKHCNVSWFFGFKNGSVIKCLRDQEVVDQLSPKCKKEVFKVQLEAVQDMRSDSELWENCKKDVEAHCKDVENGGGRVQACLRTNYLKISWECEEQLSRQDVENADDIRLSTRLFKKCLADKKQFCADIEPGHARAKQCLEDHREEVSRGCREELDDLIAKRVRDIRLDSRLRRSCKDDIFSMCTYLGDLDAMDNYDSTVINCLQDYVKEISNDDCRSQVQKYMELAAEDIRFDVPLADACSEDRKQLCANVPPGSARVIRCLQVQREKLSMLCRATLFDEEVRFSENIDFQYPMKRACEKEIGQFCKDIPHGNARVIRCLQDRKEDKDFTKSCRDEIVEYEKKAAKDVRLNFRLNKACQTDIKAMCKDQCKMAEGEVCGGKVLQCLTDFKENLTSESCKKEVFYFEKMEVMDFRTDILLAEACRGDVDKFCSNVKPGGGRVHKCLREHSKELSPACRKEEMNIEEKEAENVELNVGLLRSCRDERNLFCRDVSPGQARVFRCLAENVGNPDFGDACKTQVVTKLRRRQNNWRLDPPLRKACRSDVDSLCAAEDEARSETGSVLQCLIKNYGSLDSSCQRELGRSVHMAFFVWQKEGTITAPCDADIERICLSKDKQMDNTPGAVGTCLAEVLESNPTTTTAATRKLLQVPAGTSQPKLQVVPAGPAKVAKAVDAKATESKDAKEVDKKIVQAVMAATQPGKKAAAPAAPAPKLSLSEACMRIADIAEPPNAKSAFETSLGIAFLQTQLEGIESSTGIPILHRDSRGQAQNLSLTGWTAMAGLASLVIVLLYAATYAWKKYKGVPDKADYTLVVKK